MIKIGLNRYILIKLRMDEILIMIKLLKPVKRELWYSKSKKALQFQNL